MLYPNDFINNNFTNLNKLGYSNKEICKIIKNNPIILSYDPNNILEKINFYKKINLSEIIMFENKILKYNLNLIKARYNYLTKEKLLIINLENYNDLFLNDFNFYKKYNISKEELLRGDNKWTS